MQSISPPHLNNCPRCPVIGTQDCPDEENYHLLTLRFSLRIPFCPHAVQRMLDGVWDSRVDEYVKYSLNQGRAWGG